MTPATDAQRVDALLAIEGLEVRFGGLVAVGGVSLNVGHTSTVGLIGPNGAGKSTLFGAISGTIPYTRGRVLLAGKDLTRQGAYKRARAGISRTFQLPQVFDTLSVRQHLLVAYRSRHAPRRVYTDWCSLARRGGETTAEQERIDQLLSVLGLQTVAGRPVVGLPLGALRRVEVGRALATDPKLLLLDEPSSGLDEAETQELGRTLTEAQQDLGLSMILVEHDVEFVFGLSDVVHVLENGRLISSGTPAEVRSDEAVKAAYLGTA